MPADLFPDSLPDLDAQIAEVQRELGQRERVYPRLVANGQITQARADRQTLVMRAVLDTLERMKRPEKRPTPPRHGPLPMDGDMDMPAP